MCENCTTEEKKEVFSIREISQKLNVSEATVRRWVDEKKIKKLKNIPAIRIPRKEVERLLEVE